MAELEMEILQGTVGAVVFQNYDNGYAVLRLHCETGDTVTVVGTIPLPAVGERLMVTGNNLEQKDAFFANLFDSAAVMDPHRK